MRGGSLGKAAGGRDKHLGVFFLLQNQPHRAYFYETIDHSGHVGRNRIKKFQVYVILELW